MFQYFKTLTVASPCHTTRSNPSFQFCSDAVQPVAVYGLLRPWLSDRPRRYLASLVLVAVDQLRTYVQQLWSTHYAIESTLTGEAWIRLPRFLATDLDGFNKWHRQIVTDNCLSINKLPHYERCGLIWHHEPNLAICKCKQFWYCVNTQYHV